MSKSSLLNVYVPSGTNKKKEREEFFNQKILFYLRHNIDNIIFGGDFNCITSPSDCSTGKDNMCSKALKNLISDLGLKDIMSTSYDVPQYTFVKEGYSSRLDKIYVKELYSKCLSCNTVPVSFSDHSMVISKINMNNVKVGKGYWKLNVRILDSQEVEERFVELWDLLKLKKCHNNIYHN